MASRFDFLRTFFVLFCLFFTSESRQHESSQAAKPNALLVPVTKDTQTSLHVINIQKRTPLKPIPFLVDLNSHFLSVNCEQNYVSSTYNPLVCHSTACARAGDHFCHKCSSSSAKPGCHNNACAVMIRNPIMQSINVGAELAQDVLALQSTTQGSNPGQLAVVRRFLFACTPSYFFQGPFPSNVQGIAGFHRQVSLPGQLASQFGFPEKFAFCLPSGNNQNGVIFFGNAAYRIHPQIDFTGSLQYTPLSVGSEGQYLMLVKSIRINRQDVSFNTSLISTSRAFSGTMLSTTDPYTVLEHSIFTTFSQTFKNEILRMGATQVDAISPFGFCFKNLHDLPKVGLGAPIIDFVMQNRKTWTLYGPNSLVQARPGVWCLAFVDGGSKPRAPIVLGAHQMQDNIVEFDLERSRLGFYNLQLSHVSCGQFNFSSTT